jgi:hypothetical protein
MTLGITLYSIPNDLFVGLAFVSAFIISLILIRSSYILSDRIPNNYPNSMIFCAIIGANILKIISVLGLICTLFLSPNIPQDGSYPDFFTIGNFDYGWWVALRIGVSFLVLLCSFVFESHYLLRMFVIGLSICLAIIDLSSEMNWAHSISCYEHGLCNVNMNMNGLSSNNVEDNSNNYQIFGVNYQYSTYTNYNLAPQYQYLLAWRNIVSAFLYLMIFSLSIWGIVIHGIFDNELFIPRGELREMSKQLDKIRENLGRKIENENMKID